MVKVRYLQIFVRGKCHFVFMRQMPDNTAMNKSPKKLLLFLVATIFVVGAVLIFNKNETRQITNIVPSAQEPPQLQWKTYENTAYGYSIKYQSDTLISNTAEMNPRSVNKSEDIQIFVPGSDTMIAVSVIIPFENAPEEIATEREKLLTLPLKSFAEETRQNQINDTNPYLKNRKVGELKEISVKAQKAYSFTLTDGFTFEGYGGYTLPEKSVHNYIFVENSNGDRIMIHYPLNDKISEEIISSFEFAGTPVSSREWLEYKNIKYGYAVKYPQGGIGPGIYSEDPINAKWNPVEKTDDLRIRTSRGVFGVATLELSSPERSGSVQFAEPRDEQERFLSLSLETFAQRVLEYNEKQIGTKTKFGPDNRVVGSLEKKIIAGENAYGFRVSNTIWFGTPIGQLLIPGNRDPYMYIFTENSKGKKFLIWYPANDSVFEEIKDTFEFSDISN
jgi:hypothetical protein